MIDPKYIVNIRGKDYILYAGVLSAAHEKGLQSISTSIEQYPNEQNGFCCVAKAVVTGKDGQIFIDFGDASPLSLDKNLVPHTIRCAISRSKRRALKDFVDIGMCSVEELNPADIEEEKPEPISSAQLSLLKKLAAECKIDINYQTLDKQKASRLISQLQKRKAV